MKFKYMLTIASFMFAFTGFAEETVAPAYQVMKQEDQMKLLKACKIIKSQNPFTCLI